MKIISWNVNGIRAIEKKGLLNLLIEEQPDLLCLQETKASQAQLGPNIMNPQGYSSVWVSGERKGYSGVGVYIKDSLEPHIQTELGKDTFDQEGRVAGVHFPKLSLFNVYFPNGQMGEERLKFKLFFYKEFMDYLTEYARKQPNIIVCGDFNTAHHDIDLKNPRTNEKRSGFLPVERNALDEFLALGYVDVYRELYPEKIQYTWWDYRTRARERNAGWRIDYFYTTRTLLKSVVDCTIMDEVSGSDHCPVILRLAD